MTDSLPVGSAWKAKTLRVTAFFRLGWDVPVPASQMFWKAVFGDQPAMCERGVNHAQDVGAWNNGRASIKVEPAGGDSFRVDLTWEAGWYKAEGREILNAFSVLVDKFLHTPGFPVTTRLAFGAHAGWPADRSASYQKLAQLVPKMRIDAGMREVIVKYNRQKVVPDAASFQHGGAPINCIGTWSVQQMITLATPASPSVDVAAACEVDVNTGAEIDGAWSPDQALPWVQLLLREGVNLIEQGDGP